MPVQPTSSKRVTPLGGDFTIRFAPGQLQEDFVFNNVEDTVEFIRDRTDSAITVYVDLTAVGGTFTLPIRTDYDFRRVFLDGFFNPDGSIPIIKWPEGARIVDACDFIRKKDVDFEIEATATIPWTPNKAARMEDEVAAGYVSTTNTVPFVSTEMMGANLLTYRGGPGCGILNFGGSELIYVAAGTTFRAFTDDTCEIFADTIETEDNTSVVDIRMTPTSFMGAQTNVDPTTLTTTALTQSGTDPEETFSGKLFLRDTDTPIIRNTANTDWLHLRTREDTVTNYIVPVAVNVGTSFVDRHNFSYSFVSGESYEVKVDYMFNTDAAAQDFLGQLLVDNVTLGQADDNGDVYFHREEVKDAGSGASDEIPGTGSNQQYSFSSRIEYTAATSADLDVVYRWAISSGANNESSMWRSSVSVRRLS